jgi:GNAT superfamily N-acetyltransferase
MVQSTLPDGADLERLLEEVECAMYADLYDAVPDRIAREQRVSLERRAGELRFTVATVDHPFFNRVMGIGLDDAGPGGLDASWVEAHARHYARAGIRRYMLQILPHVEDESLRTAMRARGLVRLRGWAKHVGRARDDAEAATDLRVEAIDARGAAAWAAICAEAFSFPDAMRPWLQALAGRDGWHLYLAFDGEEPVATAAFHRYREFATLTFAATRPVARRRGAQSALIARRLCDARAAGCVWVQTETDEPLPDKPNPSTNNVKRLGLPVRYVRANWGPPKPTD